MPIKYPIKECSICSEIKLSSEFIKGRWCKSCKATKDKEYYLMNKEKMIKRQADYYSKNREEILKYWRSEEGLKRIRDYRHKTGKNLKKGTVEFKDMMKNRPQNNMFEKENPTWNDNPAKNRHGTVQKRVAEKMLGRKLQYGEVVHHIDGNALNNSMDNLKIMLRGEHSSYHLSSRNHIRDKFGRFLCL